MAPLRSLLLLGLLAVTALANPTQNYNSKTGPNSCSKNEFWYTKKSCCLPHGGPPKRPQPPARKQCPPSGWYWHNTKSCCVPDHAPRDNSPDPQCNRGWGWNKGTQCCEPVPTKPTTTTRSQPSQTPGPSYPGKNQPNKPGYPNPPSNPGYGGHKKRSSRYENDCPHGLEACPMNAFDKKAVECVDISQELRYCGGCPSLNYGEDCTQIKNAANVGCELGTCAVYTCKLGFKRSKDGRSCEPATGYTR